MTGYLVKHDMRMSTASPLSTVSTPSSALPLYTESCARLVVTTGAAESPKYQYLHVEVERLQLAAVCYVLVTVLMVAAAVAAFADRALWMLKRESAQLGGRGGELHASLADRQLLEQLLRPPANPSNGRCHFCTHPASLPMPAIPPLHQPLTHPADARAA